MASVPSTTICQTNRCRGCICFQAPWR